MLINHYDHFNNGKKKREREKERLIERVPLVAYPVFSPDHFVLTLRLGVYSIDLNIQQFNFPTKQIK